MVDDCPVHNMATFDIVQAEPTALLYKRPDGAALAGRESRRLKELFKDFGVQPSTVAVMGQMGFTLSTLVNMKDEEVDFLIKSMIEEYHLDLLMGEQFGIKAAIRAKRRVLEEETEQQRMDLINRSNEKKRRVEEPSDGLLLKDGHTSLEALGLLGLTDPESDSEGKKVTKRRQRKRRSKEVGEDGEERPREHPFIVTEPGEPAKGKKNGLDYLFDLYEQCGKFLEEVQHIAKEKGEKCPSKVTNEVFRHAKLTGAGYINKPKMRDYVHCYALHCLDVDMSNNLRKEFKERGENVGAWCQACYFPLVQLARSNEWDIDDLFNRNDKLRIWYVPTKLRQLCHIERMKHCE
ncbi:hypothetical protein M758_1G037900 [Ceratodon purpureus]|uniref:Floricaula/leafy-like transcription factor n=1 Tax=Ceratodon purpureus TaxID=3225 RepID=A0A8T0J3I5_CERPU|nr:hypothetical protein KC19_1G039900 [Ceratodon purpureus]KAG0628591.1 hypothetical protein M758_1G037900 [Ceratodon purpureus]